MSEEEAEVVGVPQRFTILVVVEYLATMALLLVAVDAASRPGLDYFWFILIIPVVLVIWIAHFLLVARGYMRPAWGLLILPLGAALALLVTQLNWPMDARFALSRIQLVALSDEMSAVGPASSPPAVGVSGRYGWYDVGFAKQKDASSMIFTGYLAGFARLPSGEPPASWNREFAFRHQADTWWSFEARDYDASGF